MSEEGVSTEAEEQAQRLLRGLCSHIVCLTGTAVQLDGAGRRTGSEIFFNISGFVVSLFGRWLWVTAGHALRDLDDRINRGEIEIVRASLADYFVQGEGVGLGIPFNYYDCQKCTIDDDTLGLDIGLVPLRPYHQQLLEANKIVPLPQDGWGPHKNFQCDTYGILGFPEEVFSRQRRVSVTGATIIGGVRPALMMGNATDAVPRNGVVPKTPWLAIELKDRTTIRSIVGMSGGPIFAFKDRPGKPPLYMAVAVQSFWDKDRRIAFGTRLDAVMEMIDRQMQSAIAERAGDEKGRT
jgi:hypothetical protein